MILLATSWTQGYPWGPNYWESVKEHCQVPFEVFAVGHSHPGMITTARPGTRADMVQHGSFLPDWPTDPNAVIVFTDADMVMQRPLGSDEIEWLEKLKPGQVAIGQNLGPGQTLEMEAKLIGQQMIGSTIEMMFPKWEKLPAWNCGVIAARRRTYERLYDFTRALLPAAYFCFAGVATIQWLICYCVGRWFSHVELPRKMHIHGHVDPGPDVTLDEKGQVLVRGRVAWLRHNLNLQPAKGWILEPKEQTWNTWTQHNTEY